MSKNKEKLIQELKAIYDNKDFVVGTISALGSENAIAKMLNFIQTAKARGDELISDNLLLLALNIRKDEDAGKEKSAKRRSVAAAML